MKATGLLSAILFFTLSAEANFKIGDWSTGYTSITRKLDGTKDIYFYRTTIVDVDRSRNEALHRYESLNEAGEVTDTFDIWEDTTEMLNRDVALQIIAACNSKDIQGQLESVTVPAGTFESCKIGEENDYFWVAPVTFGIAKYNFEITVEAEGHTEDYVYLHELTGYGFGN